MSFKDVERGLIVCLIICSIVALGMYIYKDNVQDELKIYNSEEIVEYVNVTISGEVQKPGEYAVKAGSRVSDVVYAAGGVTALADVNKTDLGARVTDKMSIDIPSVNSEDLPKAVAVVNINTADAQTLCAVPGIGEVIAERIVEYRKVNGSFTDINQLKNVKGIGEKTFEKIKDFIKTEETQK